VTEPAVAAVMQKPMQWVHVPTQHMHAIAFAVSFAISTSLHIIIGEQVPKNWAILNPDKMLPVVAAPLVAFTYILYPGIWLLNSATNGCCG